MNRYLVRAADADKLSIAKTIVGNRLKDINERRLYLSAADLTPSHQGETHA